MNNVVSKYVASNGLQGSASGLSVIAGAGLPQAIFHKARLPREQGYLENEVSKAWSAPTGPLKTGNTPVRQAKYAMSDIVEHLLSGRLSGSNSQR